MMIPNDAIAQKNMAALRKRYPEYADVLSVVPSGARYSFERRDAAICCRDADGKWLHGPEDPPSAAKKEAETAIRVAPELYILLRPGLGYLAFALDEIIERRAPGSV